ncbi:putative harbinger transposase-derived protein [Helianthus annuus]|nr:putative harbinger transposase-derived protein [Helianthus annuus]
MNICICLKKYHEKVCTSFAKVWSSYTTRDICKNQQKVYILKLFDANKNRLVFLGMHGSVDYMHWPWRICPNAWRGQFTLGDQ